MISVIVLNHNGGGVTERCLESVYVSNHSNYEVILVDNASDDGIAVNMRMIGNTKVILNKANEMYAGGMNSGIKVSKGDIVVCLANDTVIHREWLNEIEKVMRDEKVGACNPMILSWETNLIETAIPKLRWGVHPYCVGLGEIDRGQYAGETMDYVSGACFCVRKKVIEEVGMFDERMRMWWQDVDLSLRIKKAGYKLALVSAGTVWHVGGATVQKWNEWERKWRMMRDRGWFMWKWIRGEYLVNSKIEHTKQKAEDDINYWC